ncbi:hypothetical protein FVEG_06428 [Fusarium verticillioides 7600]|uniref:Uncharacterized protein n=1 Tax=Gibberella moniliformis (strain M3125 / FGSC 7600) TaxID=334819 RepID=W7MDN4_GIBM7|nr:hypothetical protein FVEG_06428 [Fusarium verticillioides 7600]EWG45745.1 hypothetical protein FVEG_06428 [Fusarium verticillioides 7600]
MVLLLHETQTRTQSQSTTLSQTVAVSAICKEGLLQKLIASNDSISSATQSELIDTALASTLDIESIDLLALMTLCYATMHNSENKFFVTSFLICRDFALYRRSSSVYCHTHDERRRYPALRAKWKTKSL